ncbi:MAG: L-seryl-tRNA(Sec) selenium transferase [Clostridia bacterium]|nr:L-seryl-tRNA(Sec) selenium transferase [Clostridia bacterium]
MDKNQLLRTLPKVDEVLRQPLVAALELPQTVLTDLVRDRIDGLRRQVLEGTLAAVPPLEDLCGDICRAAKAAAKPSLRPVINATGITLHTNLGRACLSEKAVEAAAAAARGYSTLEYDLETGERGSRYVHVENLLCRITGAEAAMVVNNNAAAVLLILSALGKGGEVITSRGELVEIGGSFRIPEIMEQCGCSLREVGATNKTHLRDYEKAIGENTRALLKVHTSNFRILGFTQSVSLRELVELGREKGLPVIEDLGSGCFYDLEKLGIHDEPTVMNSVRAGVDIISFSGDKLLGGPQAGIILCKKEWIQTLKRHPLTRAMRVDKMTLAALEATLNTYLEPEKAEREIPTLRMLSADPALLKQRAEDLCTLLKARGVVCEVIPEQDQVGGGSVPTQLLPTFAVAVDPRNVTVDGLEERLRKFADTPIIGRIAHDRYLLDVRTLWDEDFAYIADAVKEADQ